MKKLIDYFYNKKVQTYIFVIIISFVVIYGYFYPLLKYPYEAPNPWPEAYTVIQDEIIAQGKVPPSAVPQFGEWGKSDMTYFLNSHPKLVSQRLIGDLPPELIERFLSFALTFIIFLSAWLFFRYLFGNTMGFLASILFVFLPRNFNYYVNINGEYLSFIIILLALYFWFCFKKEKKLLFLILAGMFGGVLPILCLITFGVFVLILISDAMAEIIAKKKRFKIFKKNFFSLLVIVVITLIISLIPLLITKNIKAGGSSSIGSIFSQRSSQEIEFEKKYYQDFAVYGDEFINFPPFVRDIYYLSLDASVLDYLMLIYLPLFFAGLIFTLIIRKKRIIILGPILLIILLLFEIFLYSHFFNLSVYNSALRFLFYFSLPLIIISTFSLAWLCFKNAYALPIFILTIIISAIPIIRLSAWSTNMNPPLYAKPFKETLLWLKENTPPDAMVISNDWVNGQFWVKAKRLNLIEGGKASATYSTYEDIYHKLNDSRKIFRLDISNDETMRLIRERKIEYLVVWDRPSAYYIYPFLPAKQKMDELGLQKVFESQEKITNPETKAIFDAESIIYSVNVSQPAQ